MRATRAALIFALGALAVVAASPALAADACTPRDVSVSGTGKAEAAPGVYVFHIGIAHRSTDIRAAHAAVNKSAAATVGAAHRAGLADKDIRSTEVSITPVYDSDAKPGAPQVYEVRRSITLTLRDPSHYAELVESLIRAGVNRISNIEARPENPQALADQALAAAVADAVHKARLIAQKLGVELGPALHIGESGGVRPMPRMMAMSVDGAAAKGGYEHGQITVQAQVSARFALSPSGCPSGS